MKKEPSKCTLIILGETQVGKTSLINRFDSNSFIHNTLTTLGIDNIRTKITLKNKKEIELSVYDTAGQERYQTITTSFYKKANGAIIVYSITDNFSFEKITHWLEQVKENSPEGTIIYLIGNKCDDENNRVISKNKGEELAKKYNIKFYETSEKKNINVEKIFIYIPTEINNRDESLESTNIVLGRNNSQKNSRKGCC